MKMQAISPWVRAMRLFQFSVLDRIVKHLCLPIFVSDLGIFEASNIIILQIIHQF